MRKTVFILTMLLGTTIAFGQKVDQSQIRSMPLEKSELKADVQKSANIMNPVKYGNSLFTKDDLFQTTFDDVEALKFGTMPSHSIEAGKGEWVWLKDGERTSFQTTTQGDTNPDTQEPITFNKLQSYNWFTGGGAGQSFQSPSVDDGFIGIFPWENNNGVNGTLYNAYVELDATINTSDIDAVDVRFFQFVQRFNDDRFYVEWSSDNGSTWDSLELNVKYVDLAVNDAYYGYITVSLPTTSGNADNLRLRFRYTAPWNASSPNTSGGYMWMIDELSVTATPSLRVSTVGEKYYEGGYHNIPHGFKMPNIDWELFIKNTGLTTLEGIQAAIEVSSGQEGKSKIMSLAYLVQDTLFVNNDVAKTDIPVAIPSTTQGEYTVQSKVTSTNHDSIVMGRSYAVTVNGENEKVARSWARDNSALVYEARYNSGPISDNVWSDELSDDLTTSPGYSIMLAYTVPEDSASEDFFVNGIEFVASTRSEAGSPIALFLVEDSNYTTGEGSFVSFRIKAGGNDDNYVIKPADISSVPEGGFVTNPQTVSVMFSDPYKIKPGTTLRACYEIADVQTNFWLGKDGVGVRGQTLPGNFGMGNRGNLIVYTPSHSNWTLSTDQTPMIRLLVGPHSMGIDGKGLNKPSFKLNNYPNPAKENTTIKYTLPENANVTIEVRDLMGRVVKSINGGMQASGDHSYELTTSGMSNGTYFYSLIVNGSVQTKKMVVNK